MPAYANNILSRNGYGRVLGHLWGWVIFGVMSRLVILGSLFCFTRRYFNMFVIRFASECLLRPYNLLRLLQQTIRK